MKEKTLRDYFENRIGVDILAADVEGSQKRTSFDVISVRVEKIVESGEFEITRSHLIKLCDDAIAGHLTDIDLNTIAFSLTGSDHFIWSENPLDGKIIGDTINDWDSPEIGFPITIGNLKLWKKYLESGEYELNFQELKKKGKKDRTTKSPRSKS